MSHKREEQIAWLKAIIRNQSIVPSELFDSEEIGRSYFMNHSEVHEVLQGNEEIFDQPEGKDEKLPDGCVQTDHFEGGEAC